jgi:hypothetical protein
MPSLLSVPLFRWKKERGMAGMKGKSGASRQHERLQARAASIQKRREKNITNRANQTAEY